MFMLKGLSHKNNGTCFIIWYYIFAPNKHPISIMFHIYMQIPFLLVLWNEICEESSHISSFSHNRYALFIGHQILVVGVKGDRSKMGILLEYVIIYEWCVLVWCPSILLMYSVWLPYTYTIPNIIIILSLLPQVWMRMNVAYNFVVYLNAYCVLDAKLFSFE